MNDARVNGVVETALYVKDIEVSHEFYQRVFRFPEIFRDGDRLHALGVAGKQVLLLFRQGASTGFTEIPGGRLPPHDGHGTLHVAFAIDRDSVEAWRERLRELNVPVSSEVTFPGGGRSIYFRDPDDHLLELVTPGVWSIH